MKTDADGRRRGWFVRALILAGSGLLLLLAAVLVLSRSSLAPKGSPRAAILDQLALTFPDQGFVDNATRMLKQAGYVVDYFPGEAVTLSLYESLPGRRYDLILFRVHAARVRLVSDSGMTMTDTVGLFTSEVYRPTEHRSEIEAGLVGATRYFVGKQERYFGILPAFIQKRMDGDLHGADVILMGCDTLSSDELAAAFLQKGAECVVGWEEEVSAPHSDLATERLLRRILVEKMPTVEAVRRTSSEVGQDPIYGGRLLVRTTQPNPPTPPPPL